jgi:hypothetical protein
LPVAAKIALAMPEDRGRAGLADAARRLRAVDDMRLDLWRFVHAQHLIRIEVRLLD